MLHLAEIVPGENYRPTVIVISKDASYQNITITAAFQFPLPGLGNRLSGSFSSTITELVAGVKQEVDMGPVLMRETEIAEIQVTSITSTSGALMMDYQGSANSSYLRAFEVERKVDSVLKVGAIAAVGALVVSLLVLFGY